MSCICVQQQENKIVFAYDSLDVFQGRPIENDEKVFEVENGYIGFVGNVSTRQELTTRTIQGVSDLLRLDAGEYDEVIYYDKKLDKIFRVELYAKDFYIVKAFDSIGSGSYYALGAYEAGASLRNCVKIACKLNIDCGLPVRVKTITRR